MKMTFSDFQKSRRECADLSQIVSDIEGQGFVYAGDAYIEKCEGGEYMLTLHNQGWMTPDTSLEFMEAILYSWCLSECPDGMGLLPEVHDFICNLQDAMGLERFAEMMLLNRAETIPDVCHMHDYCDPNQCALDVTCGNIDHAAAIYNAARPFLRG